MNNTIELDYDKVKRIIKAGHSITSMESCTGGLFASTITDCEGASNILEGSVITYSNATKIQSGVSKDIIDNYGVYSLETATSMARACKKLYNSNIAIGITGSLSRIDPNNIDSVVGNVDYCLIMFDKEYNYHLEIPQNIEERIDMKKYIVNDILDKICIHLENE